MLSDVEYLVEIFCNIQMITRPNDNDPNDKKIILAVRETSISWHN